MAAFSGNGALAADLEMVADQITMRLGHLEVLVTGWGAKLPWSCAEVVQAQDRGEDPTGRWRQVVTDNQGAMYGTTAPAQVGAAFVLQWYLGLVANPVAWAAVLGPYVLNATPEALRFDLTADAWYPCSVSVIADGVELVSDDAERLDLAHTRYLEHATRFVEGYRPGVKMGTRQRRGMIRDAWVMAVESAREAFGTDPVEHSMRESCCFIYALPGANACARCPRRATPAR